LLEPNADKEGLKPRAANCTGANSANNTNLNEFVIMGRDSDDYD
jgi:hypothetical protein